MREIDYFAMMQNDHVVFALYSDCNTSVRVFAGGVQAMDQNFAFSRFGENGTVVFVVPNSPFFNVQTFGTVKLDPSAVLIVGELPCFSASLCPKNVKEFPLSSIEQNLLVDLGGMYFDSDFLYLTFRSQLENGSASDTEGFFNLQVTDVHRENVGQQHQEMISPGEFQYFLLGVDVAQSLQVQIDSLDDGVVMCFKEQQFEDEFNDCSHKITTSGIH